MEPHRTTCMSLFLGFALLLSSRGEIQQTTSSFLTTSTVSSDTVFNSFNSNDLETTTNSFTLSENRNDNGIKGAVSFDSNQTSNSTFSIEDSSQREKKYLFLSDVDEKNKTSNDLQVIPGKSIPVSFSSVIDTIPVHPRIPRRSLARRRTQIRLNRHSTRVNPGPPVRFLLPPMITKHKCSEHSSAEPPFKIKPIIISSSTPIIPLSAVATPLKKEESIQTVNIHPNRRVFVPPPQRHLLPPFINENYNQISPSSTPNPIEDVNSVGPTPTSNAYDSTPKTHQISDQSHIFGSSPITPIVVPETHPLESSNGIDWKIPSESTVGFQSTTSTQLPPINSNENEGLSNRFSAGNYYNQRLPSTSQRPQPFQPHLETNEHIHKEHEKQPCTVNQSSIDQQTFSNYDLFPNNQNPPTQNLPQQLSLDHSHSLSNRIQSNENPQEQFVSSSSLNFSPKNQQQNSLENFSSANNHNAFSTNDHELPFLGKFQSHTPKPPPNEPAQLFSTPQYFSLNNVQQHATNNISYFPQQNREQVSLVNRGNPLPNYQQPFDQNTLHDKNYKLTQDCEQRGHIHNPNEFSSTNKPSLPFIVNNLQQYPHNTQYASNYQQPFNNLQSFDRNNQKISSHVPKETTSPERSTSALFEPFPSQSSPFEPFQRFSVSPTTPQPSSTTTTTKPQQFLRGPNIEQALFDTGDFQVFDTPSNISEESTVAMMNKPLLAQEVAEAGMKIMANPKTEQICKASLHRGKFKYNHLDQFKFPSSKLLHNRQAAKPSKLIVAESSYYNDRRGVKELTQEQDLTVIPGRPGIDYPILSQPPANSNFSCQSVSDHRGYVADPSTDCQVFYICVGSGPGEPMLCPNGTLFSQDFLVCDWWFNLDCQPYS